MREKTKIIENYPDCLWFLVINNVKASYSFYRREPAIDVLYLTEINFVKLNYWVITFVDL